MSNQTADELKAAGNSAFSSGAHSAAIVAYTTALSMSGAGAAPAGLPRAVLLTNRAAALLARGSPGDNVLALSDATAATREAPTYGKAFARKGAALMSLGQYEDSLGAFAAGMRVEPGLTMLRTGRDAVIEAQARARAETAAPPASTGASAGAGTGAGAGVAAGTAAGAGAVADTEDPLASFLADVGGLATEKAAAAAMREAIHAPKELAREAVSASEMAATAAREAAAAARGRLLTDGAASECKDGLSFTGAMVVDAWAAAVASGDADEAAARAAAISKVSTGREYELEGEAAAAQSAALLSQDLGDGETNVARLTGPRAVWLNLDPFAVLLLPHTANDDDIKARFRKLSALVHPDKCAAAAAGDAFQEVKKAVDALADPNRRRIAAGMIASTHKSVLTERRRAEARLIAAGVRPGPALDAALGAPLADALRDATRKAFAEAEFRKRNYEERIKTLAAREADEAAEAHEIAVAKAKADEVWAEGREKRMENWLAFGAAISSTSGADGGAGGGASAPEGTRKRRRIEGVGAESEDDAGVVEGASGTVLGGQEEAAAAALRASNAQEGPVHVGGVRLSAAQRYGASAGAGDGDAYRKKWR